MAQSDAARFITGCARFTCVQGSTDEYQKESLVSHLDTERVVFPDHGHGGVFNTIQRAGRTGTGDAYMGDEPRA